MNINNCNHTDTEKHQEEKIFLYTTITGNLQLIHLEQIGYFRYNSKSKLWEAVLNNNHTLALKRNTNSQKILSLHPYLIQISQSHIINISYLVSIEDNNCILLPPFNEMELLQVSKSFMKKLRKISMYLIVYSSSLCSMQHQAIPLRRSMSSRQE